MNEASTVHGATHIAGRRTSLRGAHLLHRHRVGQRASERFGRFFGYEINRILQIVDDEGKP
jgi:hypothetical protein